MVVTGDDSLGIDHLTRGLHAAFSLEKLGSLSYLLGLEVHRTMGGDCTPVSTPMELNLKLGRESRELLEDGVK
ncbi:unnamed protein product [Linum trigynum]|uniref:Reverse transcriptase Ty1/copia-type domain-containing protein n=1 Tax=Linum trigynum TaxID=586398 RepID=A0AAV2E6Q9_9ROSI